MKILLSGSSGLVGKELTKTLISLNHKVLRLIRDKKDIKDDAIFWDPENNILELDHIKDIDAVIHLAGENIANKRWSKKQKEIILESRVKSTKLLSDKISNLDLKPQVFISASAIGYYGTQTIEPVNESDPPGKSFLSYVCENWENSTKSSRNSGIRTVNIRIGIILSPLGGALKKMLTPFKLGLGGKIGDGNQIMSWISLEDTVKSIIHILNNEHLSGPVNLTNPNPVNNYEFTKKLGKKLSKITIFPLPKTIVKLIFGEMGEELLLSSIDARPDAMISSGYKFTHENLSDYFDNESL